MKNKKSIINIIAVIGVLLLWIIDDLMEIKKDPFGAGILFLIMLILGIIGVIKDGVKKRKPDVWIDMIVILLSIVMLVVVIIKGWD